VRSLLLTVPLLFFILSGDIYANNGLKISDHQQRWSRPFEGAILIPSAMLVVADSTVLVRVSSLDYFMMGFL
jgi:hypothetical protein